MPVRFSAVETAEHYLTGPLSERIMPLARRFDTIWFGSDEAAKAQRMSLVAFAIRVGSAGLAFLSQVVMARWTGSHEYGIYVFVWTAVLMLSDFSCLGFSTVVIRFLPQYVKDGDIDRLRGLLLGSRLLDPPLHEFLPHGDTEFEELAEATGIDIEKLRRRAGELHEFNPMLGHRGCRLGITYPEIYEMQARAIFEAACQVAKDSGEAPVPEIMIPLVATKRELELLKDVVDRVAKEVFTATGVTLEYLVGTMIELPRAALMAGEIAEVGEFFSFGTNGLTQTTLAVSGDDAGRFLTTYVDKGIFARDPFVSLDVDGVGQLVELAAERGRETRDGLKLGICGEHGGDPASIAFCEKTGLDYVSASPYRVPIARLAAAQASLR